MQNKTAFIIAIVGMFINDMAFVVIWWMFFNYTGSVNGWGNGEMILMQGIHIMSFGLVASVIDGIRALPDLVYRGRFDWYLTTPRNLYFKILTSKMEVSAIGDLLMGLTLIILGVLFTNINNSQIILLLIIIPASTIIISFSMIINLVAFYFDDPTSLHREIFELFFTPGFFPGTLITGLLRTFYIFVMPSLLIAAIPVDAILSNSVYIVILLYVAAIFWFVVSYILLFKSVKRYESGNLLGVR